MRGFWGNTGITTEPATCQGGILPQGRGVEGTKRASMSVVACSGCVCVCVWGGGARQVCPWLCQRWASTNTTLWL